jgi:type I restriction enzyme S subunit
MLKRDDIIISARGTVGEIAMIPFPMAFNQSCYGIRAKPDLTDKIFLYYLLKFNIRILKTNVHGSVFDTITRDTFDALDVNLPPLPTQKKIASILSSLDDKIELNTRMNKVLEEIARALFHRWFVEFEFPDAEGRPYKSSGGKMVESEIGLVPEGWEVGTLGQMVNIMNKSISPTKSSSYIFEHYSIPAFDECKLPVYEIGSQIKSNKFIITKDCFMISKLNPSTKRIWRPCCKTENAICSTEFIVYNPKNPKHKDFYYSIIDSCLFTDYLNAHVTGSTGSRQRVKPKDTLSYNILLPLENVVDKYCDLVKPVYEMYEQNYLQNQGLRTLRDTLLPKLMSGQIKV